MVGRTKREEVYLNAGGRCEMCGRPLTLDARQERYRRR